MEPGGNVDYERFYQEIIEPLLAGQTVLYHPLDCKTMSYKAQVTEQPHMLNIIEGAYCQHSYFGDIYDLRIFMVVGAEEQKLRVKARDPWLYGRYIKEWIPMENSYSSFFGIKEQSDYVIYT